MRRLVSETYLNAAQLVLPLFVRSGRKLRRAIKAMPGVFQLSPDEMLLEATKAFEAGVPAVLLTFRRVLSAPSFGQTFTDSEGRFAFPLRLRDTEQFEIRVDAPDYRSDTIRYQALDALSVIRIPLYRTQAVDSPSCAVDCNGDGHVDIEELISGVAIALGNASLQRCEAADSNQDERVSVSEIVAGVDNALVGCGAGPDGEAGD